MNIRPRILYPSLIVAAISVTVLSLTGVAALTGHLPGASAGQSSAQMMGEPDGSTQRLVEQGGKQQLAAAQCNNCGTVESVRLVEHKGSGSGLGAVAGGVAGALLGNQIGAGNGRTVMTIAGGAGGAYLGNEIEKNSKRTTSYQIKVRMADGSTRTVYQQSQPSVTSGDKVRVSNGGITEVL